MKKKTGFEKHFKKYEILPETPSKYAWYTKVTELPEVRVDGYIVRLPFYVQGKGNAHILFSPKENPSETDNVYELGKLSFLNIIF